MPGAYAAPGVCAGSRESGRPSADGAPTPSPPSEGSGSVAAPGVPEDPEVDVSIGAMPVSAAGSTGDEEVW